MKNLHTFGVVMGQSRYAILYGAIFIGQAEPGSVSKKPPSSTFICMIKRQYLKHFTRGALQNYRQNL